MGHAPAGLTGLVAGCAAAAATAGAACALLVGCAPAAASTPDPDPSVAVQPAGAAPTRAAGVASAPARAGAVVRPAVTGMLLSIPAIGVQALRVIGYVGHPDDLAGTLIEDRGLAASPQGRLGGVVPGQVGNLIITGHRTSAGGPLRRLPDLRDGARILISSGGFVYDYVVSGTMRISFRLKASLALQSAAVPGHPGLPATRAMVTLSTCATPEDHAAGDYWKDALGNPEHRIDKIGVLVAVHAL